MFALPPPPPLDIHDLNAAGNWKESEQAWKNYSIAMNLHQKPEAVHTASNIDALIGLKREKFSLRLPIGRVIPTKIRSSQCYKGLQRTISHLKRAF